MNPHNVFKILVEDRQAGTGFFVGQGVVITAFHVIGNRKTQNVSKNIKVQLPENNIFIEISPLLCDFDLDVAILSTSEVDINRCVPFQLRDQNPVKGQKVEIIGYPIIGKGKKLTLNGRISGFPTQQHFEIGNAVSSQQLTIDEKIDYRGISGGPVIVNDMVIGVFRWQLFEEHEEQPTGIAFCTLISDILSKNPSLRSRFQILFEPDTKETRVLSLLKMMGYRIQRDIDYEGIHVPILAIHQTPLETHHLVVGFREEHLTILQAYIKQGGHNAVFIATEEISNEIQSIPGIIVKKYHELSNSLIDFSNYIDRVLYDYEHYETYVSKSGELIRLPIIDELRQCDLYRYFVTDYLSCRPINKESFGDRESLAQFIDKWLSEPGREHLSILGDYGVGKTSFCLYLTYQLSLRYKEDTVHKRIPLFVPLKGYSKTSDWEKFIIDLLKNQYGIHVEDYIVFQKFLESGRLILILDGFDEMIDKTNRLQTIRNFEEFAKFVVPGSKVILTCRTHYFIDQVQLNETLGQYEDNELLRMVRQRPNFELILMEEFADEQIIEILKKYRTEDWQFAWATVKRIYNLKDLARRAILLDMIVRTLPSLLQGKTPVRTIDIYEAYTRLWIEREDWRSVMTIQGKRAFMQNLATLMWKRGKNIINYRDIRKPIEEYFQNQVKIEEDLDYFEHDTRTCSFLLRDAQGNYRFAHKSFYEFFIASNLANEINTVQPVYLQHRFPTVEIFAFLRQLVTRTDSLIDIIQLTRYKPFEEVGFMGSVAATLAILIDNNSLKGKDLGHVCLKGADFTGANLTETNFRGADLRDTIFSDVSLNSADIQNTNLNNAKFIEITSVRSVTFSSDNRFLVSGGMGGTLIFWDITAGKKDFVLQAHNSCILSIKWSPDNSLVANAYEDGVVNIWQVDSQKLLVSLKKHEGPVYALSWGIRNGLLASAGDDGKILIWSPKDWTILHSFEGGTGVLSLDWSLDGKWLVSSGIDRTIKIWNTEKWSPEITLLKHRDYVRAVKWMPNGNGFASCSDDGTVKLWEVNSWEMTSSSEDTRTPILSITWHPYEPILAGGMRDDSIKFWQFPNGHEIKTVKEHVGRVWDIVWSSDGQILSSAGNEGCVRIWSTPTFFENGELKVSQNFGVCLNVFETRFACASTRIKDAQGLNAKGYPIIRHKDRPWETRDGTLQEWLLARGAIID